MNVKLILCLLLSSVLSVSVVDSHPYSLAVTYDTNPPELKLTFEEFEDKLLYYLDMMKGEESFTEDEYVEMVLVDNTYFVFMSTSDTRYKVNIHKDYLDNLKNYMDDILKVLEAKEQGCNGGFYSKKYNLCVGGTSPNKNSVYIITD